MNEALDEREQKAITELIEQEQRRQGKPTIERVEEAGFFDRYNNEFSGYFVWVKYPDGRWEIWFVVDVRGGLSDNEWHVENIT